MNSLYENFTLKDVEERFGYEFEDKELLVRSLMHASFSNENGIETSYERMEFLGDAVLQLLVSDYLYRNHSELNEGEMSKLRSKIVSKKNLVEIGKKKKIQDYIILGHGEKNQPESKKESIIGDIIESLIAAVYLDSNYERTLLFIKEHILVDIDKINDSQHLKDHKTEIQELVQIDKNQKIKYLTIPSKKGFKSTLIINDKMISTAHGVNKKDAEMKTAEKAIKKIKGKNEN